MKQSSSCPKCLSTDIARINPFKSTSTTNYVQLNKWGTHLGYYDRYVCLRCGFMEMYALLDEDSWQKWIDKMREENALDSDFV